MNILLSLISYAFPNDGNNLHTNKDLEISLVTIGNTINSSCAEWTKNVPSDFTPHFLFTKSVDVCHMFSC